MAMSTTPARLTETAEIREALADMFRRRFALTHWQAEAHAEGVLRKGPVATLFADRDAALAERDEARRQANRTKEVMLRFGLRFIRRERLQVESCRKATAQADRTASELAAAKARVAELGAERVKHMRWLGLSDDMEPHWRAQMEAHHELMVTINENFKARVRASFAERFTDA